MKPQIVFFGASNMLGELIDCAMLLGYAPKSIVTNIDEQLRPRTKSLAHRLEELREPPAVVQIDEFSPADGEHYFLGTTAPARDRLVASLTQKFRIRFVSMIHPSAHVSPTAAVHEGVFVGAASVIGSMTTLGSFCFINRGVSVGHDCTIEPFSRLMPGCNIGGHVQVGTGATIGMGANVLQEVCIGSRAFIALGAGVTRDVPPDHFAAGTPARLRVLDLADSDEPKVGPD